MRNSVDDREVKRGSTQDATFENCPRLSAWRTSSSEQCFEEKCSGFAAPDWAATEDAFEESPLCATRKARAKFAAGLFRVLRSGASVSIFLRQVSGSCSRPASPNP